MIVCECRVSYRICLLGGEGGGRKVHPPAQGDGFSIDSVYISLHTDYGLPSLRQQGEWEAGGQWSEQQEERKAIPKVYQAPEVRSRDLSADHGSTLIPADVYRSV